MLSGEAIIVLDPKNVSSFLENRTSARYAVDRRAPSPECPSPELGRALVHVNEDKGQHRVIPSTSK